MSAKKVGDIPLSQQRLAAMYFTTENLGQPTAKVTSEIEQRFHECWQNHACEGISIEAEYRYWQREVTMTGFHGWDWVRNIWPKLQSEEEALSHGDHLPVGGSDE